MDETSFEDSEFLVGWCAICAREVLTFAAEDGPGSWCVHCGEGVGGARAVSGEQLRTHGYDLADLSGCGRPDCGGGRCGRHDAPA